MSATGFARYKNCFYKGKYTDEMDQKNRRDDRMGDPLFFGDRFCTPGLGH